MYRGLPVLAWFLYVLSASLTVRAEDKPCTLHADGNYYDLNRLQASKDYDIKSASGRQYILNVCKPVSHETWALKVDKPEDVAGFTRRAHGDFSMGDVNTTVVLREGNPLIFMTDGSRCSKDGDLTASTAIRFICDSSAGTGACMPTMIATLPPDEDTACAFVVEWRTEMACPTSEGGIFGTIVSVLAISIAVLFGLYLVGGTLYNRYVLELRGMDQIPSFSFFSLRDSMEFIQDCVGRLRRSFGRSSDAWQSRNWGAQDRWGGGGSWGGSGRAGYSGLRASAEEEEGMLPPGPPGFLDEEDEEEEEMGHGQANGPPSGMDSEGGACARGPGVDGCLGGGTKATGASRYSMYAGSEDYGELVYPQIPPYQPGVVQHHPGPPPRQMSEGDLQHAMQYRGMMHMPGQFPPSPNLYDPLSPPVSGSDTSDGIYHHSRNSSANGSPSSSRANSLVHRHPLRFNPTPSPTSSSGRRSRGQSPSDDEMGPSVVDLANTRKEATRRQRIEAEQRRRDELRDGYARLKDVLPVSNQKSSKVSLLERATAHIVSMEKTNRQLQARLQQLESEVTRLRSLNEKISLGVNNSPSPGQGSMDSRPLSPPPEGTQPSQPPSSHQLNSIDAPGTDSSPSASEGDF
ncbi:uncharacterized protein BXZ73DRAFT_39083 [Epithele typhae]|uniref:uncharacterized protein n=1 Tax=Epithele typhae TaxID=378194 RepID=UPI0020077FA7|nr:uncharacterized protein BXZ73DRAFT_39083 [Epithele typhae]KAH9943997.1 hypothetical protein BXZ73DRAFT_39083 [Epithele typhae]